MKYSTDIWEDYRDIPDNYAYYRYSCRKPDAFFCGHKKWTHAWGCHRIADLISHIEDFFSYHSLHGDVMHIRIEGIKDLGDEEGEILWES